MKHLGIELRAPKMVDLYIHILVISTTVSHALSRQIHQQESNKTIAQLLLGDVLGVSSDLISRIDPLSVKVLDLAETYVRDKFNVSEEEETLISDSFGRARTIFGENPNDALTSIQQKTGQILGQLGSLVQSEQVQETLTYGLTVMGSVGAWLNHPASRNVTKEMEKGATKHPNRFYQLLLESMRAMKKDLFPASEMNLEEREQIKNLLVRNLNSLPGLLGWLSPSKELFDLDFYVPDPLTPLLLGVVINLLALLLLPWFSIFVFILGQLVSLNLGWIFISDVVIDTLTEMVGSLVKSALPLSK